MPAPARTAASEFATPHSASLWQWMPTGVAERLGDRRRWPPRPRAAARRRSCRTASPTRRPPRPPRARSAARSRGRRARRRRSARRRRRRSCPRATRKATESAIMRRFSSRSTRTTFSRCRLQVLPTIVQTGAKQPASSRSAVVLLGGHAAPAGHPEGGDLRVAERLGGEQVEELGLLRVRGREPGLDQGDAELVEARARRAASRRPRATSPRPACRRAGCSRRRRSRLTAWSAPVRRRRRATPRSAPSGRAARPRTRRWTRAGDLPRARRCRPAGRRPRAAASARPRCRS